MKRNGFTLIELLSVIIILVIIAMISIPVALNVINQVQKNAFKNTAYGLIDAVKLEYAEKYLNEDMGDIDYTFPETEGLTYRGDVPDGGIIRLTSTGKISVAIYNDKWCITKSLDESNVSILDYEENKCFLPEIADVPIINLNGEKSIYLSLGREFVDPGYTVRTVAGEELKSDFVHVTYKGQMTGIEVLDTSIEEIYTITYTAQYRGNESTETRVLHVGNYKPTVMLEPNGTDGYVKESEVTISVSAFEQYSIDIFQYIIIKDDVALETIYVDGLSETVSFTENGNYQIKVIATDSEGNVNEFVSEVYKIDTIPPTITFQEGDAVGIRMNVNEVVSYNLKQGVDVTDNGVVRMDDVITTGSLESSVGNYPIVYQVADQAGNSIEKVRRASVYQDSSSEGIYITEVKSKNENDIVSGSTKVSAYQTILDSDIALSSSNSDSSVTFTVSIYNGNDLDYRFDRLQLDSEFEKNENVTYSIDGLSVDDILASGDTVTFDVTFQYKTGITPSVSVNSFTSNINFIFDIASYVVGTYNYAGKNETFVVPHTGLYKIELWGAEGGKYSTYTSGKGAYTVGILELSQGEDLFVTVGGQGSSANASTTITAGGYNGGGGAYYSAGTGGGATDIRYGVNTLNARIMVAAGGGGTGVISDVTKGGAGGTLTGYNGGNYTNTDHTDFYAGYGGTQIAGGKKGAYWTGADRSASDVYPGTAGSFGIGGKGGYELSYEHGAGGGGGGYYGGAGANERNGGGAGGSSYISGYQGCVAITSATSTTPKTNSTGSNIDVAYSYHYSGKIFHNTNMISGNDSMPTHDGLSTMTGNTGNGYAKITFIESISE